MGASMALLWALVVVLVGRSSSQGGLPGSWELLLENAGVASMHTAVTRLSTVVLLDRTDIGATTVPLPAGRCRDDLHDLSLTHDCTAHSLALSPETGTTRPLTILTDTWCSSGHFLPDGTLVQTGGDFDGAQKIRHLAPCADCDWVELEDAELAVPRWYSTNQILPDGRAIIIGGKDQFNLEFVPSTVNLPTVIDLPFLRDTSDAQLDNLYPFVHLLPDGNLFIFANQDAILYDYTKNAVVRNYPRLEGSPRNYPSGGSSVMLPLTGDNEFTIAEVLLCGGASAGAFLNPADQLPAEGNCGRITATDTVNPQWVTEAMPFQRIMGDLILLPSGDVIIINGAQAGSQGFDMASMPVLNPVLYRPSAPAGLRFMTLTATSIPRMYHSTANLLPDGRILVAGSNPHYFYNLTTDAFPTELRVEAFSPEYLSPGLANLRPALLGSPGIITYGSGFDVHFVVPLPVTGVVEVNIVSAAFSTHSFAQGQRLLKLHVTAPLPNPDGSYLVSVQAPPGPVVAPPSFYMMFLVNQGIPSIATWVQIMSAQ